MLAILDLTDRSLATLLRYVGVRLYKNDAAKVLANIMSASSNTGLTRKDERLLLAALVAGEDRRFWMHPGIDARGIARAARAYLRGGPLQGASTITQQLVRVATGDYRISLGRKFKEMALAALINAAVAKEQQALAYLGVAYFGWRMNGIKQALRRLNPTQPLTKRAAAEIVARLRYPDPATPSPRLRAMIERRAEYIASQIQDGHFPPTDPV